jgi:hypothetical protein
LALARPAGIAGVALGTLLTTIASQAAYVAYGCRYLGLRWVDLWIGTQARPLLAGAAFLGPAWLVARIVGQGSLPELITGALMSLLLYVPLALLSLEAPERETLLRSLRRSGTAPVRNGAERETPGAGRRGAR